MSNPYPAGSWKHQMYWVWEKEALEYECLGRWRAWRDIFAKGIAPKFSDPQMCYRARPGFMPEHSNVCQCDQCLCKHDPLDLGPNAYAKGAEKLGAVKVEYSSDEPCPHCGGLKTTCDAILMKIEMGRVVKHATGHDINAIFDAFMEGKITLPENVPQIAEWKRESDQLLEDLKRAARHRGILLMLLKEVGSNAAPGIQERIDSVISSIKD